MINYHVKRNYERNLTEEQWLKRKDDITKYYLINCIETYLEDEANDRQEEKLNLVEEKKDPGSLFLLNLEVYLQKRGDELEQESKKLKERARAFVEGFVYRIGICYLFCREELYSFALWTTRLQRKLEARNQLSGEKIELDFQICALNALKEHLYSTIASELIENKLNLRRNRWDKESYCQTLEAGEEPW